MRVDQFSVCHVCLACKLNINQSFSFSLQCYEHEDVPWEEQVFHAFSHVCPRTPLQLRKMVSNFFSSDGLQTQAKLISSNILPRKKMSPLEYSKHIIMEEVPADELAISCLGLLSRLHVFVYMKGAHWSTHYKAEPDACVLKLAYLGQMRFVWVCERGATDPDVKQNIPERRLYNLRSHSREMQKEMEEECAAVTQSSRPPLISNRPDKRPRRSQSPVDPDYVPEGHQVETITRVTRSQTRAANVLPASTSHRPQTRSQTIANRDAVEDIIESDEEEAPPPKKKAPKLRRSTRVVPSKTYGVRVYGPKGEPFRCKICDKWFSCVSLWDKHELKHNPVWSFRCPFCNSAAYIRKFDRDRHIEERHPKTPPKDPKPFKCPSCASAFATKRQLQIHSNKHKPHKKCPRTKCPFTYWDPTQLRRHREKTGH